MKTTADFLDALRVKLNLNSDGKLADYLGMHRQHVSRYRTMGGTFDDEMCIRVAEILEIEPAFVMASMHHQRAKNPKVKAVWEWTAQHLGGLAAALAVLAVLPFGLDNLSGGVDWLSSPALLAAGFTSRPMYIMSNAINTYW
jgi:hypothetical protein